MHVHNLANRKSNEANAIPDEAHKRMLLEAMHDKKLGSIKLYAHIMTMRNRTKPIDELSQQWRSNTYPNQQ